MPEPIFHFKRFSVRHDRCAVKVGTDGVVLGAWANLTAAQRILDIGAGSGVIALITAQRNPLATIDAVEIDEAAATQAAENFTDSPWRDRLRAHQMDVRRMHSSEPYDVIISNPPFYAGEMDSPDARNNLAKHGGELSFAELVVAAGKLLSATGRLALILPLNRERELCIAAAQHGLLPSRRCTLRYLQSRPAKRVLLELQRSKEQMVEEELVVEAQAGGPFTEAYRTLLSELMLKF